MQNRFLPLRFLCLAMLSFGIASPSAMTADAVSTPRLATRSFASRTLSANTPLVLPFSESFTNAKEQNEWTVNDVPTSDFGLLTDINTVTSSDSDNGFLGFMASKAGEEFTLTSAPISISGAQHLTLCFSYYKVPGKALKLTAELLNEQGQATTVRTIDYAAGAGAARWLQAVESVQPAAGTTTVRLRFRLVATATNVLTGLDAIHLFDARQGDLGVRLSTTPKVVKGIAAHARVTVQNLSAQTLNTFSLKVSAGHQPIATETVSQRLRPMESMSYSYSLPTSSIDPDSTLTVTATVTADGDTYADNNQASGTVALEKAWRHGVRQLRLTAPGSLSWEAPAPNSRARTEDFEEYEPWTTAFGDWTLIDADKATTGGVFEYSDYPHVGEKMAFIIMNPSSIGDSLAAHSGQQFAGAPYAYHDETTDTYYPSADNWLISPELSGREQDVSFWVSNRRTKDALGNDQDNDEYFYFLGSKTTPEPKSFTDYYASGIRNRFDIYMGEWQQYTLHLAKGTRYFAIRHVTPGGDESDGGAVLLMLDDFSFEEGGTPVAYRVYRDGALAATVGTTSWTAADAEGGSPVYSVTAVYKDGSESEPAVVGASTGISTLKTDAEQRSDIYAPDGRLVRRNAPSTSGLTPGIYIINHHKVIVK